MIAWTALFAVLSVAAAKPQLDLRPQVVSTPAVRSQVFTSSQPQFVSTPTQYVSTQPQFVTGQTQYVSAQPQFVSTPTQYVSTQPKFVSTPTQYVSTQPQYVNYQSFPLNTVNYQQVPVRVSQPALRTKTVRPTTTFAAQPIQNLVRAQPIAPVVQAVQPAVVSTVAPVTVQQHVVPHIQHHVVPQVQQRIYHEQPGYAILRQVQDLGAEGNYVFGYETENGIKVEEEGKTVNIGTENESAVVQGSYSYQSPEGQTITVTYVADENGYRAEGEHIPKAPEAILRSVEYLRSLPPRPEDKEGQYVKDSNGY